MFAVDKYFGNSSAILWTSDVELLNTRQAVLAAVSTHGVDTSVVHLCICPSSQLTVDRRQKWTSELESSFYTLRPSASSCREVYLAAHRIQAQSNQSLPSRDTWPARFISKFGADAAWTDLINKHNRLHIRLRNGPKFIRPRNSIMLVRTRYGNETARPPRSHFVRDNWRHSRRRDPDL